MYVVTEDKCCYKPLPHTLNILYGMFFILFPWYIIVYGHDTSILQAVDMHKYGAYICTQVITVYFMNMYASVVSFSKLQVMLHESHHLWLYTSLNA